MTADLPFSRPVPLRTDGPSTSVGVAATPLERAAVAQFLDLQEVDLLEVDGVIDHDTRGFRFDGRVRARVTQRCVVTFDPVPAALDLRVRRTLVVGGPPVAAAVDVDPLADEIDYLEEPSVDLGRMAVEELSLGLDPYPRAAHADAALAAVATPPDGPFAALARRGRGA